jgi:hypothetical protein
MTLVSNQPSPSRRLGWRLCGPPDGPAALYLLRRTAGEEDMFAQLGPRALD